MREHVAMGFIAALEKTALIERLMRLAATDVEHLPGVNKLVSSTPRMFMRHRSPEELGALQHGVEQFFSKKQAPVVAAAHGAIGRLPGPFAHPRAQAAMKAVSEGIIRNPELLAFELSPLPGSGSVLAPAWVGAKRGIERVIDRVAPVPLPPK